MTLVDDPIVSKEQDLQKAKQAIAGPVPLLPEAPDTSLSLAVGLYHNGEFYNDAEVRELTGVDEEKLSKVKDEVSSFSTVIALGTTRIGPVDLEGMTLQERKVTLGGLLLGDREKLFLNIVRVTFGNVKQLGFRCTFCAEEQEIDLLLDEDFPQKEGDVSARTFSYTTTKADVVEYRLATGQDQEDVLGKAYSPAEANTQMLSRCITKVNGNIVVDPLGYARTLGMKDRSTLLAELTAKQPSISMEVRSTCVACGEEVALSVDWATIFRP